MGDLRIDFHQDDATLIKQQSVGRQIGTMVALCQYQVACPGLPGGRDRLPIDAEAGQFSAPHDHFARQASGQLRGTFHRPLLDLTKYRQEHPGEGKHRQQAGGEQAQLA
ncbi:hypothetical protein [endosymbiont of Riftia pachyptila]|uniref:hypothetical protein n=1 Tax=endosymbiont of Riftia pachyptila TaxID=54396 RepID=UPI0005878CE4|nr:hypothetical protein [endosymbiont of Riftia pachyptila]